MALVKWHRWGWPSLLEERDFRDLMNFPEYIDEASGLDIYETDDAVIVEAQVPGIQEKDVDVTVEGNILTISAKREETEEEKEKKKTVYKCTRQTSFHYTTTLPRMVNAEQAEAEVENGVVKITVPKAEEEKPKKVSVRKKI